MSLLEQNYGIQYDNKGNLVSYGQAISILPPPIPVGGYCLGKGQYHNVTIMMDKKPNIIHRFFMKLCLGIIWIDNA